MRPRAGRRDSIAARTRPACFISGRWGTGSTRRRLGAVPPSFGSRPAWRRRTSPSARPYRQTEPSGHPNAYGLFWGGSDLSGPNQQYSYFVIRQGGMCHIRKRMGSETSTVVPWTAASAINDLDADGRSTNKLTVEVVSSQVRFLVNDMEVVPRSEVDTDGITGLRVTHLLDVHIGDLMLGM